MYVARNFAKITGLESPEPLANLYSRSYFRATWITTALDAGFWTAMKIRNKRLRDLASMVFSAYYLIAAEQADEKVRKVRATLTVDHMRVAWNKPATPYLFSITSLLRPHFTRYGPRALRIPRPSSSGYDAPIDAFLYFNGSLSQLQKQTNLVLDVPGGGFVAMDPRCHEDKLLAWAGKTGLPILSLNYRKAPEYPYPYALNECYDAYHSIVATKGRCIGLQGDDDPRIVLTGDSAGGNLATGVTLMIIQAVGTGPQQDHIELPLPAGLVLIYPALDMNIGSWMTDDQMALIRNPRTAKRQENYVRRKSEDIDNKWSLSTPRPSETDENVFEEMFKTKPAQAEPSASQLLSDVNAQKTLIASGKPQPLKTRLAVSSLISYFGDRILTPEMMRAMIILYVGPYARPDFTTDHLLSPAVAPETLLARFPKTYILTGERDPLVDDTVIFAGRLRQAKLHLFRERKELGLEESKVEFDERAHVEIALIPGISHGFLQFVSVFPQGWKHIFRCGRWIEQIFRSKPTAFEARQPTSKSISGLTNGHLKLAATGGISGSGGSGLEMNGQQPQRHHRRFFTGESSADDDDVPLEMTALNRPAALSFSPETARGKHFGRENQRMVEREQSPELERSKSTASLASEDGLLKRRMNGLTIGLMGGGGGAGGGL
ncbi:MAG: hypothetical protein Q9160_003315 [Pyrenula sp. 1 TL-2023]